MAAYDSDSDSVEELSRLKEAAWDIGNFNSRKARAWTSEDEKHIPASTRPSLSIITVDDSGAFPQQQAEDGDDEGFRLFSTSVPGDHGKVEPSAPVKWKPPPSSSDSDSEWERLKEAAVSGSDLLQQSTLLCAPVETTQAAGPVEAEHKGKGKKKKKKKGKELAREGGDNLARGSDRKVGEQVSEEGGLDSSSKRKSKQMCQVLVSGLEQTELTDGTAVRQGHFATEEADLERSKKKKVRHKSAKPVSENVKSNSYKTKKKKIPVADGS
ncbi:protein CUSTOS isoform X2 [Heptranchias perlo]|uniref:protein CUSTOS isoform X2 n=1 Tax=Heptranchias perlo TaxID=212740 RepID=UPI003559E8E1